MKRTPQGASAPVSSPVSSDQFDACDNLVQAQDVLSEARFIAEFVQSITLVAHGRGVNLDPSQTTGLYYVMQDMLDRVKRSEALLRDVNVSPNEEGETA